MTWHPLEKEKSDTLNLHKIIGQQKDSLGTNAETVFSFYCEVSGHVPRYYFFSAVNPGILILVMAVSVAMVTM